jgi:hypothetical protein
VNELGRQKWEELRKFAADDYGQSNVKIMAIHTLRLGTGVEIQVGRPYLGEEVVGIFDVTSAYAVYTLNAGGTVDRGKTFAREAVVKAEVYS